MPVSGRFGMGEYARATSIAGAAAARWSPASVHFVVSREAPYAASVPFAATVLKGSPTRHSDAVIDLMRRWRPHVVVFDNAGRTVQLRAARALGARVVFVSARRRQRRRAFRLRWMRLLDEHWLAYPEFLTGPLGPIERLKLAWMGRPIVRRLDVILARPDADAAAAVRARAGVAAQGYTLVVPGGGTGHPRALDAAARFYDAACALARGGESVVFVGGAPGQGGAPEQGGTPGHGGRASHAPILLERLPQAELAALMSGARLVIANGGGTLLQAIAMGRACIGVPIAGDQPARVRGCARAGVALAAQLDTADMLAKAHLLLDDESRLAALAARAAALALADGIAVASQALEGLVASVAPAATAALDG